MPYRRSEHRLLFEASIDELAQGAKIAQKLSPSNNKVRDMAYQCAVFRTSALIESYLKIIIESWLFALRQRNRGDCVPHSVRSVVAVHRLENSFIKFFLSKDEHVLINSFDQHASLWPMLQGEASLPPYFDGKIVYGTVSYPSFKNMKRLFRRIGIHDFNSRVSHTLNRDVETLIEGFQSVRTALAHSAPPALTYQDVKRLLGDSKKLVGALDRVLFMHVSQFGGVDCWS